MHAPPRPAKPERREGIGRVGGRGAPPHTHGFGQEPADLQRGQTVQIRLTLGDPAPALMIPNGAFYDETGGNWIFVVAPDGRSAVRRNVRLGRRNADFIEVLSGLDPGERVITSPYTGFAERDRLSLSTQ